MLEFKSLELSSLMNLYVPLPCLANSFTRYLSTSLPNPKACTLVWWLSFPTILQTSKASEIIPSVKIKRFLGRFEEIFYRSSWSFKGSKSSVPPISPSKVEIYSKALSKFSFEYSIEFSNIYSNLDPKLKILKNEPSDKLLKKRIKASLAFSILDPHIDALQSRTKINSAGANSSLSFSSIYGI